MKSPAKKTLSTLAITVFSMSFCVFSHAQTAPTSPLAVDPEAVNSCIASICGPAEKNMGYTELVPARVKSPAINYKNYWRKNFQAQLETNLSVQKESQVLAAQRLIELLKENVALDLNHPYRAMIAYKNILGIMKDPMMLLKRDRAGIKFEVKTALFDEVFAQAKPEQKQANLLVLEQVIIPLFNRALLKDLTGNTEFSTRLTSKFPNVRPEKAQIQDAESLLLTGEKILQVLGRHLGSSIFDQYRADLISRVKNGEILSPASTQEYLEAAAEIELYGALMTGGELTKALMAYPINFQDAYARLKTSTYPQEKLKMALGMSPKAATEKISASCEIKLAASMELSASDFRLRRVQEMIAEVKNAAAKVTERISDSESAARLGGALKAVEFTLPPSNKERIALVDQAFKAHKNAAGKRLDLFKNSDIQRDQMILFLAVMEQTSLRPEQFDLSLNSRIQKVCDSLPTDILNDHALTSAGKIVISWNTAAYPQWGVGVIAHELGHVASLMLRNQRQIYNEPMEKFFKALTCVANRNPNNKTLKESSKFTNSIWSEEDFADYFSTLVMTELKSTQSRWYSDKNMACQMVSQKDGKYSEKLTPGLGAAHSSGLLRLLMIAHDRGITTPQCQGFYDDFTAKGLKLSCQ